MAAMENAASEIADKIKEGYRISREDKDLIKCLSHLILMD